MASTIPKTSLSQRAVATADRMNSNSPALLDACVLLPMPLADTLLRMAERPRLYVPRWSDDILDEVSRNLVAKLHKTPHQALRREQAIRQAFPAACVPPDHRDLIPRMTNDPKDRHVLSAAVASSTPLIITYNLDDFKPEDLDPWNIAAIGPSEFLERLYLSNPQLVVGKLMEQSRKSGFELPDFLLRLHRAVPSFVDFLISQRKTFP